MPHIFQKPSTSNQGPATSNQIVNPWANDPILDPSHELPIPEPGNQTPGTEELNWDHDPIKTYLEWTALSRPFRKKDRSYFQTLSIIVGLLILISLLAGEYMLVAVLLALSFVAYVMGLTPPDDINYKISTQGVTIGEHFYFWDLLDSFWLSTKEEQDVVHILTHLSFPKEVVLVINDADKEKIKRILARYLPYHEIPPKTLIDHWAQNLQKWFPLEKQTTNT